MVHVSWILWEVVCEWRRLRLHSHPVPSTSYHGFISSGWGGGVPPSLHSPPPRQRAKGVADKHTYVTYKHWTIYDMSMSNPNIKQYASLGGLARAAKLSKDRQREIMSKARLAKNRHECNSACTCKHCGVKQWRHGSKCYIEGKGYVESYQCVLASISIESANISITDISLRAFIRRPHQYLTGEDITIATSKGRYKVSKIEG